MIGTVLLKCPKCESAQITDPGVGLTVNPNTRFRQCFHRFHPESLTVTYAVALCGDCGEMFDGPDLREYVSGLEALHTSGGA